MLLPTLTLMMIATNYGVTPLLDNTNDKCGLDAVTSNEVNLFLHSRRNTTGRWKTTFAVQTDATNKPLDDGMELNLKQSVIKCGDKQFLLVRGVLEQDSVADVKDLQPLIVKNKEGMLNSTTEGERLGANHTITEVKKAEPLFFQKGAKNTEFSNEKRTVKRKTGDSEPEFGGAITNRPLKDGELFEVTLDEITTKWSMGLTIGLTTQSPAEINFPGLIARMRNNNMVYKSNIIYNNGAAVDFSYGIDIEKLKVGERVGVMKKEGDTVHFFVNGVDQGAVIQKFCSTAYGVVDVVKGAVQATIVNPK